MKFRNLTMTAAVAVLEAICAGPVVAGNVLQTVQFPGVSAESLYNVYLSSSGHAAITGYPAHYYRPSTKTEVAVGQEGDELRAFGMPGPDGKLRYMLRGKILTLVPNKEIVMTWKTFAFGKRFDAPDGADVECIVVLTLRKNFAGTEIQLVQTNIPDYPDVGAQKTVGADQDSETTDVNTNWYFRYWEPMLKYFQAQARNAQGSREHP